MGATKGRGSLNITYNEVAISRGNTGGFDGATGCLGNKGRLPRRGDRLDGEEGERILAKFIRAGPSLRSSKIELDGALATSRRQSRK